MRFSYRSPSRALVATICTAATMMAATGTVEAPPATAAAMTAAAGAMTGATGVTAPWRGAGELAVVSGSGLRLFDNDGISHLVAGPGRPIRPAWSADGRWVAFLRAPAPAPDQSPAYQLWVARSDGSGAHRVSAPGADVSEFYWAPGKGGEKLAFSVTSPTTYQSQLFVAMPSSLLVHVLPGYSQLIGFSWSPDGTDLAVSYRTGKPATGEGLLRIVPVAGGPGRVVYRLADYGYVDLSTWWPDGRGLLFWDDPAGSASIAADGLTLDSLDLSDDKVSRLATTLVYDNFVAWSPGGGSLAVVAGPNRMLWDSGKHLEICSMPAATCRDVPLPAGQVMSLGPTWRPGGQLVYDVAPGSKSAATQVPAGVAVRGGGPWSNQTVAEWYGRQRLYVTGATVRGAPVRVAPVRGAPSGAHDPLATSRGLLYVRDGHLWYLPLTIVPTAAAGPPLELSGPLPDPNQYGNFYGYIDWAQDFAWHAPID